MLLLQLQCFPSIWIKNSSLAYAAGGEIKVGVLFSLTGTTGIIEESLNKATVMAIEEINDSGGVNGMKIVPVVEDPASDPATFAAKARKLVLNDKCVSVFWLLYICKSQSSSSGV